MQGGDTLVHLKVSRNDSTLLIFLHIGNPRFYKYPKIGTFFYDVNVTSDELGVIRCMQVQLHHGNEEWWLWSLRVVHPTAIRYHAISVNEIARKYWAFNFQ